MSVSSENECEQRVTPNSLVPPLLEIKVLTKRIALRRFPISSLQISKQLSVFERPFLVTLEQLVRTRELDQLVLEAAVPRNRSPRSCAMRDSSQQRPRPRQHDVCDSQYPRSVHSCRVMQSLYVYSAIQ